MGDADGDATTAPVTGEAHDRRPGMECIYTEVYREVGKASLGSPTTQLRQLCDLRSDVTVRGLHAVLYPC